MHQMIQLKSIQFGFHVICEQSMSQLLLSSTGPCHIGYLEKWSTRYPFAIPHGAQKMLAFQNDLKAIIGEGRCSQIKLNGIVHILMASHYLI